MKTTLKFQELLFPQKSSYPDLQKKIYVSKESKLTKKALLTAYAKKKANNTEENTKEYLKQKKDVSSIYKI